MGSPFTEALFFSAGPEAQENIMEEGLKTSPFGQSSGWGCSWGRGKSGEMLEDRRSGAGGCPPWPDLSAAGPSAQLGMPGMKKVPDGCMQ